MSDKNPEVNVGHTQEIEVVRAAVHKEVQAAPNQVEKTSIGKRIRERFNTSRKEAQELRHSSKSHPSSNEQRTKAAQNVKQVVVEVFQGIKDGVIEPPKDNIYLLQKLDEKVVPYLTNESAPHIYPLIEKLLAGKITVGELEAEFADLKKDVAQSVAKRVSDAIIDSTVAGNLHMTPEEARQKFDVAEKTTLHQQGENDQNPESNEESEAETEQRPERDSRSRPTTQFEADWVNYYQAFFGEDEGDMKVIGAFYDINKFKELIQDLRNEVVEDNRIKNITLSKEETDRLTSEALEREIVLRFSKIFLSVDRAQASEFWDRIIAKGGIYDSPQAVENRLSLALVQMTQRISRMTQQEQQQFFGSDMTFYTRFSEEGLFEKEVEQPDGTKKILRQYRVVPSAGSKTVSLGDFLQRVMTMKDHEMQTRQYLHNVQALFLQPAGEGGFWGQLSRYSEQVPSADIDSMMLLPDNEKFMTAYRLYTKYLEEELAKVNWIHQPTMFSSDYFNNRTKIEQRVLDDMMKLYPEELKDKDAWRLHRAVSMAVGLAKGVFLSEPETAAWADPAVTIEEGKPKYTSYYTNDTAALNVLNPQHTLLRWQAEGVTQGPLIFLPIFGRGGKDKHYMRWNWDHRTLWDEAEKFHKSFMNGYGEAAKNMPPLFVDLLPNFARAGSYLTRGGWRMDNAIDGWLKFASPEGGQNATSGKILALDSWKAIENIGYEAAVSLRSQLSSAGFFGGGHGEAKYHYSTSEKQELFSYLYNKYITFEKSKPADVNDYIKSLSGENDNAKIDAFMNKVMVSMLAQRLPSKLIRVERDRLTKDGVKAWDKVRDKLGWNSDKMDENMRAFMMVEAAVREDASRQMKEGLKEQTKPDATGKGGEQDLSKVEVSNYKVDEDTIRKFLTGKPGVNIEEVVALHNKIENFFKDGYLDNFMGKMKTMPFALGVEELDHSFIALRNSGPRVLARALSDTSGLDQKVFNNMTKYLGALHEVSINPKHDVHGLVQILNEMKRTVESFHGHGRATQVAYDMAALTIAYFKKDALAKNMLTKLFAVNRPNSLAAEFAGTNRGVWEWEVADIDNFIVQLERERILPKVPTELATIPGDAGSGVRKKFLGLIPYMKGGGKMEHYLSGKDLRDNFGANKSDIAKELLSKYLPLFLVAMLYTYISKALKEQQERK